MLGERQKNRSPSVTRIYSSGYYKMITFLPAPALKWSNFPILAYPFFFQNSPNSIPPSCKMRKWGRSFAYIYTQMEILCREMNNMQNEGEVFSRRKREKRIGKQPSKVKEASAVQERDKRGTWKRQVWYKRETGVVQKRLLYPASSTLVFFWFKCKDFDIQLRFNKIQKSVSKFWSKAKDGPK